MPCTARWVCGSTACPCRRPKCWRPWSPSRWPRRPIDLLLPPQRSWGGARAAGGGVMSQRLMTPAALRATSPSKTMGRKVLRAEVPLVLLDVGREVRPLSPRSQEDMAELVAFRLDPGRIVECTSRQSAHAGNRLEGETEVRAAAPAELDLEPSARFVGDVSITRDFRARHLDLIAAEHDFRP